MVLKIHMERKVENAFSKKNKLKSVFLVFFLFFFFGCCFVFGYFLFIYLFKDRISFDVMGALNMSSRMLSKEII